MATTRAQLSYLLPLLDCINSGSAEYIQRYLSIFSVRLFDISKTIF